MVTSQLNHSAFVRDINPRIAHVTNDVAGLGEQQRGDRAPHSQLVSFSACPLVDRAVRIAKCARYLRVRVGRCEVVEIGKIAADDFDRHFAGNFAGGVPTHAIGDDEKSPIIVGGSVQRIFVTLSNSADISASRNSKVHYRKLIGMERSEGERADKTVEIACPKLRAREISGKRHPAR
jgi:hypothetical protein